MIKKIFASVILFICLLSNAVFAYKWVQYDGSWYVLNETTNVFLSSVLFDAGDGVYYLKEDGRMVTGWWKDPSSGAYYFFDNRNVASNGRMIFGLHMIDGFYHYFLEDGKLATSDKLYELKQVYGNFKADYDGYLYSDDKLLRDISLERSEFYSNTQYYYDANMNNLALSNIVSPYKSDTSNMAKSQVINEGNYNDGTNTSNPYNAVSNVAGGTNYYIDEYGRYRSAYVDPKISDFEIYGPAITSK